MLRIEKLNREEIETCPSSHGSRTATDLFDHVGRFEKTDGFTILIRCCFVFISPGKETHLDQKQQPFSFAHAYWWSPNCLKISAMPCLLVRFFFANLNTSNDLGIRHDDLWILTAELIDSSSFGKEYSVGNVDRVQSDDTVHRHRSEYECSPIRSEHIECWACRRSRQSVGDSCHRQLTSAVLFPLV